MDFSPGSQVRPFICIASAIWVVRSAELAHQGPEGAAPVTAGGVQGGPCCSHAPLTVLE